jgi:hypothetical protein
MQEESLGFVKEHFSEYPHTKKRMWDVIPYECDTGEVLQGRPKAHILPRHDILQLHNYVLEKSVAV